MLVLWFFVPSALNAQTPTVDDPGGVVNGASFAADAVVAGSEATVLGSNLASSFFFATSLPLPTILGDTTVSINGNPVPLLFVSPDRIRLQVPWELASETQVSLTVTTVSGGTSSPVTVNLASVGPGIFDASAIGGVAGDPAILKADFTLVTGSNPAPPGEVVLIFAAGLGPVTNQPLTGGPSPGNPLSETIAPTAVTIGGIPASVLFSGLTPGFVAFYQVNVEVPANVTVGPAVPVVLIVGGVSSNTVTMAIDPDPDNDGIPIPDDNCPFTANPSQADSDADATGNACDECINDFGPSDNAGCPRPEVPPGTVISSDPSTCDIVADGQFASNACMEWADITPVVALGGDSIVYQSLDADSDAIYVMYDYILSQTPLAVGEESGFVRFSVGDDVFDVFFTQGGPSGTLDAGDTVRVLKNGSEYDNSLGSIVGAVDFNSTSPNFPQPHNLFELKVVLLQTPETPGGSPPEEGGLYSPDSAFWSAFLPGSPLVQVSAIVIDIEPGGKVAAVVSNRIDVKPGDDPNSINTKSMGAVAVAILGSETFDVADVDVTTLAFGPAGTIPAHDLTDPAELASHLEDVNGDGFTDLVSHYSQKLTGLAPGDLQACIVGQTSGGAPIFGCDSVNIVK